MLVCQVGATYINCLVRSVIDKGTKTRSKQMQIVLPFGGRLCLCFDRVMVALVIAYADILGLLKYVNLLNCLAHQRFAQAWP